MDNEKRQLKLEAIWDDEDIVEVRAFATNGRYCGTTEVYTTSEALLELADNLTGFPKTATDSLSFSAGEKGGYSYLGLRFYCTDGAGHTAIEVCLEENVPSTYRPEEKPQVSFELPYEPSAMDEFIKQLRRLAILKTGAIALY